MSKLEQEIKALVKQIASQRAKEAAQAALRGEI